MNSVPPSGPWAGYYLYGHAGIKHRMRLHLTFADDGRIDGEGVDDIATFDITGHFDGTTGQACWLKAYRGMHTVQYSGIYCKPSICGDWNLGVLTGGFWIWPASLSESESSDATVGLDLELETVDAVPSKKELVYSSAVEAARPTVIAIGLVFASITDFGAYSTVAI